MKIRRRRARRNRNPITREQHQDKGSFDQYEWEYVATELARPLGKTIKAERLEHGGLWRYDRYTWRGQPGNNRGLVTLPASTLVMPKYRIELKVTDADRANVHFIGDIVADLNGDYRFILGAGRQLAKIPRFEAEGWIDLRTGEMRLSKVLGASGMPTEAERVWLIQFLRAYGPWRGKV